MITVNEDEIYCFKLISGEEVIARVAKLTDSHYGLHKPLSVGLGPDGPQLVPTMMSGNLQELFWVRRDICAITGNIGSDMYAVYQKSTTALELPVEKKILRG